MKNVLLIASLFIFSLTSKAQQSTITTFILVRHAEKVMDGTKDPDLKPEGIDRAVRLAAILKETQVNAIYSTDFKRTKNTILPYATIKGLPINTYETFKEEEIDAMLKKHSGETILIIGHSNNIPWIANLLAGQKVYGDFKDDDYGNIFIISVVEKGKIAKITLLRY